MSTEYAWFLPTGRYGDGHRVNAKEPERPPTVEYLSEVARTAERAGFVNLLLPTGTHCLDAWMIAAAIARANQCQRVSVGKAYARKRREAILETLQSQSPLDDALKRRYQQAPIYKRKKGRAPWTP